MAKASSPVRLQAELMEAASRSGKLAHRSAAEQVEYWASIGRTVGNLLTPQALLALRSGLAQVKVEPIVGQPVDSEALFASLDQQRASGELSQAISSNQFRYQASHQHPGLLERVAPDGQITIGQFHNGEFQPVNAA
ncbi:TA system antitoxin ParD family protein [Halioxenophilus sp. WMMB6]|uniref:TA system antitoxin ParD family protein n=1 Tax=Halioxenophilus sp. WMMB6 TaxID=3073815 RepID=UPI00295EE0A4|nr:hypothetical protein [Halioxenophilus sp. WMMB6]